MVWSADSACSIQAYRRELVLYAYSEWFYYLDFTEVTFFELIFQVRNFQFSFFLTLFVAFRCCVLNLLNLSCKTNTAMDTVAYYIGLRQTLICSHSTDTQSTDTVLLTHGPTDTRSY